MVTDALIERFARAMFDVWPLHAVSRALAEQSGQEVGSALTYDKVLEMGGNHDGLLRLASGAAALHAEIERELATRPTADLGEDGELVDYFGGRDIYSKVHELDAEQTKAQLILYREALELARPYVEANADRTSRMTAHHKGADVLDKIDAVLSRSGG